MPAAADRIPVLLEETGKKLLTHSYILVRR